MSLSAGRVAATPLLAALLLTSAAADNGAVAVAYPGHGIAVDGDLSDWSPVHGWYEISLTAYGQPPRHGGDFRGRFRVAYDTLAGALLVGVEVRDGSAVRDETRPSSWDTQDGCEVYVHGDRHGPGDGAVRQHMMYGGQLYGEHVAAASSRWGDTWQYEWRLEAEGLGGQVSAGDLVGFDVAVCDRDDDGSFSWMVWGRGEQKVSRRGRLGDLLLADTPGHLGTLAGHVQDEEGAPYEAGTVQVRSLERGWVAAVRTQGEGFYTVAVPVGQYQVQVGGNETVADTALVRARRTTRLDMLLRPAPLGRAVAAGSGRNVRSGGGELRQGWRTFRVEDGLPSADILTVFEDREGSIWLGTSEGVTRYDGRRFTTFTVEDGLPDNRIQSIHQDTSGAMWFGTGWFSLEGAGVVRYDGASFTTLSTADGLPHNSVQCIYQDSRGAMWFGTHGGVSRYDGHCLRTFTVEDGLGDNPVQAIAEDAEGAIWLGTGFGRSGDLAGGVTRLAEGRTVTFTTADGLGSNWVSALHFGRHGELWVGTLGGGVSRLDSSNIKTSTTGQGLASDRVMAIGEDAAGKVWLATGMGLRVYDGELWTSPAASDRLGMKEARDILFARDGSYWVPTGGGVAVYDGRYVRTYTGEDGLPDNTVASLLVDGHGDLWASGSTEVSRFDGSRFVPIGAAVTGGARVTTLMEDRQGAIWLGTEAGVRRLKGQTTTRITTREGLTHDRVTCMLEDRAGAIWIGTRNGLTRYADGRLTGFTEYDGLPHGRVLRLVQDHQDRLWVGTHSGVVLYEDGQLVSPPGTEMVEQALVPLLVDREGHVWLRTATGVARYGGDGWAVFDATDGLPGAALSMMEARSGDLWIAAGNALCRYDGRSFATYTSADGLTPGRLTTMTQDRRGHLWFGMYGGGVARYGGSVFQSLTTQDGLLSDTVVDLVEDHSGDMWIGTEDGVTRYRTSSSPPDVRLRNVRASGPYSAGQEVRLPSTQRTLGFEFDGASMKTRPEAMVYRYRLRGYDSEWRVAYGEAAEYLDLPRGTYTFEVVAVDRDLDYSVEPASAQVTIHLPYERIGWGAALGLVLALSGFQAVRLVQRDRRLHDTNAALAHANEDLTEEVRERERAEAERARLDEQLGQLRYLNRLRASLEGVRSVEGVLRRAGEALSEVLADSAGSGVEWECDGRNWLFGEPAAGAGRVYDRPLEWGERRRGRLAVRCSFELSESQERALLDETASQVARALEAQELMAQLLQSARLVSLGEMAAGVAHELNQPLAAISTVAGDVHLRMVEERRVSDGQLKEMMADILGLVRRMSGTISHLRVFSRDTAEDPAMETSLNEVVHGSLKVIGTQLANHGIQVELDLSEHLPAVHGQPFQLEQVFLNLLANGRDALDERGRQDGGLLKKLCVRTRLADGSTGGVCAEVEDNGVGIDAGDMGRLFEPFYTTKEAERGTGLGLSISYAIVQNHGGRLSCASRKGEGTVFTVALPAKGGAS